MDQEDITKYYRKCINKNIKAINQLMSIYVYPIQIFFTFK